MFAYRQDNDGGDQDKGENHPVGSCQPVVVVWSITWVMMVQVQCLDRNCAKNDLTKCESADRRGIWPQGREKGPWRERTGKPFWKIVLCGVDAVLYYGENKSRSPLKWNSPHGLCGVAVLVELQDHEQPNQIPALHTILNAERLERTYM